MTMSEETVPFIIDMPVLDDETVAAVNTFLWDLVTQFESQYLGQLQRYHRKIDALDRDPLQPWKRITPAAPEPDTGLDDELNDDIPF